MLVNHHQLIGLTFTALATITGLATTNESALSQTINLNSFVSTAASKHNAYRRIHRSPALVVSSPINATAQAWANQLATTGTFAHSASSQRKGAGENLYVFYTTASAIAPETLANKAVQGWYDEVKQYRYTNPVFAAATGHFTQVVWKSSTQLGCGAAKGTKTLNGTKYNAFYVVCHYAPAGNVRGQFAANVLKP
jgi:ribosomal protein L18